MSAPRTPKTRSPTQNALSTLLQADLGRGAASIAVSVAREIADAIADGLDDDAVADRVAGLVRAMKPEIDRLRASKEKLLKFLRDGE
jgi:hypothetical protein